MSALDYSTYLRLPELLSAQRPLTSDVVDDVHVAEHFFIVVHQGSELWLKHILLELDAASSAMGSGPRGIEAAVDCVNRGASACRILVDHVALLRRLSVSSFAAFRARLGTASGAQSSQFRALQEVLGQNGEPSPLYDAFLAAVAASGTTVRAVYADPLAAPSLYRLAEALVDLAQAFWGWQQEHVQTVARNIGLARRGTGGSNGLAYLISRIAMPFPELWEARTSSHEAGVISL